MTRTQPQLLLFLCTGNYYRSRFAEILFNSLASRWHLPWKAASRALALERGVNNVGPMAVSAIKALQERGIQAAEEVSRLPAQVTLTDLEQAQRIVALKREEHLPLVEERFPGWSDRIEFWHIDDVPGVLPLLEQEIMNLVARLMGGGDPPPCFPRTAARAEKLPRPEPLTLKVGRETAGRRGKGVTTIFDIPLPEKQVRELAATVKQRCGTGGTVKDGRIEIQGDNRERVIAELEKLGFRVKRVGG